MCKIAVKTEMVNGRAHLHTALMMYPRLTSIVRVMPNWGETHQPVLPARRAIGYKDAAAFRCRETISPKQELLVFYPIRRREGNQLMPVNSSKPSFWEALITKTDSRPITGRDIGTWERSMAYDGSIFASNFRQRS